MRQIWRAYFITGRVPIFQLFRGKGPESWNHENSSKLWIFLDHSILDMNLRRSNPGEFRYKFQQAPRRALFQVKAITEWVWCLMIAIRVMSNQHQFLSLKNYRRRRSPMRSILCTGLCLILCAVAGFSQTDRGTITGTVTDPAGAVIPGAQIEAENINT